MLRAAAQRSATRPPDDRAGKLATIRPDDAPPVHRAEAPDGPPNGLYRVWGETGYGPWGEVQAFGYGGRERGIRPSPRVAPPRDPARLAAPGLACRGGNGRPPHTEKGEDH